MPKDEDKIKILSENLFPVVGVGASAGGLDAFRSLIRAVPLESGMAYILVQHLHPEHTSSLAEILQRETSLPVLEITDNVVVKPDNIYIIPSNKILVATDGILQLSARPRNEKNMPIDIFFKSLAEVHQSHSIGVVLSGTGNDGTAGLKSIKDYGGITIAEDPLSATYDTMPVSAINENVVDFILYPDKIPEKLLLLQQTLDSVEGFDPTEKRNTDEENFRQILSLLRLRKGVDFTYYKQTTIRRRILRRMLIIKIENLKEYLEHLRKDKSEQDDLFQDLLIPVSSFFRDPNVFTEICESVFPDMIRGKNLINPLRLWIAGCSTGQEAYSYGICLHEFLSDRISEVKIQIFATDLSTKAIAHARAGLYSIKELEGVSDMRLQLFFTREGGHYRIKKNIRDMFVFSEHNFIKDPPFGNIDLISCRNVLIYLEPFLQRKAFNTFHYGLKEKGILVLGKSETIGNNVEMFTPLKKSQKIFQKKLYSSTFMLADRERAGRSALFINKETAIALKDDYQKSADDILLAQYTPSGVIVNEDLDIVQFRGSTGNYLEASPGRASLNILKMAREGLSFELRNAIYKAKKEKKTIVKEGIPLHKGNALVTIEVIPLTQTVELHFLILFTETAQLNLFLPENGGQESFENYRNEQLEKELAQAREDMRAITENQEAANEELQSANEELLSGSEELQSLNEELETSKEELQSTNEELITVNQELYDRNEMYNQARLYAEAIISTIHEPLVVLFSSFTVKSANPAFYKKFELTDEEVVGKAIYDIGGGEFDVPFMRKQLKSIKFNKPDFIEWEDQYTFSKTGTMFLCLNAQPIAMPIGEQLILLAFEDITMRKEREKNLVDFSRELEQQVLARTETLKEINLELSHSNKNLEQFASIASHDLQEPLRKILTFAKLLNQRHEKHTSEETKELLSKIVLSSERMSVLIKDVLTFSRMSDPDIAYTTTDLNVILKDVISDFDLLIREKKARIDFKDLPVIEAVPIQMNQLLYNLISNSLKFTSPDKAPHIKISTKKMSSDEVKKYPDLIPDGIYHEIHFSDNGIGFDQEYASQIFLIFQRLHSQSNYAGTGIGLALCEKIVNCHHGLIQVEGKENEGAHFYVILPERQPRH